MDWFQSDRLQRDVADIPVKVSDPHTGARKEENVTEMLDV